MDLIKKGAQKAKEKVKHQKSKLASTRKPESFRSTTETSDESEWSSSSSSFMYYISFRVHDLPQMDINYLFLNYWCDPYFKVFRNGDELIHTTEVVNSVAKAEFNEFCLDEKVDEETGEAVDMNLKCVLYRNIEKFQKLILENSSFIALYLQLRVLFLIFFTTTTKHLMMSV